MPKSKTSLDKLIHEIRRVSKSREVLTDKKIDAIYKSLNQDLNAFLAETYIKYADKDGRMYISYLDKNRKRAWFMSEIAKKVDNMTPALKKEIMSLVDKTYTECYKGMIEAIKKADTADKLAKVTKDLNIPPEVLKQAVNNNISKLTLPEVLERNRAEVTYQIQQELNIGLMNGDRYETMAKRIAERIKVSKGKAMNITRTETHRNIESGLMDSAEVFSSKLEGSDLIYAVTWRTMQDNRVRPLQRRKTATGWKTTRSTNGANHIKMEGETIKVGEMFDLGEGIKTKAPSQSGHAKHDCNCRCFLAYNLLTVEEFANITDQTPEQVRKKYGMAKVSEVTKAVKDKNLTNKENNVKIVPSKNDDYGLLIEDMPKAEQATAWKALQSTNITPEESLFINKHYTRTTNSWTINNKLREYPDLDIGEIYRGNSKNAKTVKALRSVIRKNTMPQNATLTRNAGYSFAEKTLGLTRNQLNAVCEHFYDEDIQDELKKYIGTKVTDSAFVSTSANPKMNVFSEKPVRLELKVNKGHNAFITENIDESEVILDRGTQYVVEGFDIETNRYDMPVLKIIAKVLD